MTFTSGGFLFLPACLKAKKCSKELVAEHMLSNKVVCRSCHSVFWMENRAKGVQTAVTTAHQCN